MLFVVVDMWRLVTARSFVLTLHKGLDGPFEVPVEVWFA